MTFASEKLAKALRAKRLRRPVAVSAVGCVNAGTFRHEIEIIVSPRGAETPALLTAALILRSFTTYAPHCEADASCLTHLADLRWADPNPLSSDPIDLIIGADLYSDIVREGLRRGGDGQLMAQNSVFGWFISGPITRASAPRVRACALATQASSVVISAHHCKAEISLEDEMRRFWEVEEVPRAVERTPDDERCERHFVSTHSRTVEGRYVVRLPFRSGPPIDIGSSRSRAVRCLAALTRRLQTKPEQRRAYDEFLREYELSGHMRRAPEISDASSQVAYIPHHPVFRSHSATTKLRVVFNASSPTTNGSSLNDHLIAGPKLQTDLSSVLLRWRNFKYACSADIEKMYRQIQLDLRDVDYQRILWHPAPDDEPREYQLMTVTYGMSCAPFLALRVLQQLRIDDGGDFPLAAPLLKNNIYVDDVLFGSDDVGQTIEIRNQLTALLRRGGFELRKWSGNSAALLADLDEANHGLACTRSLAIDESVKILGITWTPAGDNFQISVSLPACVPESKRSILSTIAKLYDPLGWVTPITISAKIFMQHLWRRQLEWDDPIPEMLASRWRAIFSNLSALDGLRIPRWTGFGRDIRRTELHGFADASNSAYSAVVYLRLTTHSGQVIITLLTGKSRVAPLQPMSIPRLELSAAVLLSRLVEFVRTAGGYDNATCCCWSDSTVVLSWLAAHPSRWRTFVANRVAEVHARLPRVQWRHVPTADNPADCASRGLLGLEILKHDLWWRGPSWLTSPPNAWPSFGDASAAEALSEERVVTHLATEPASLNSLLLECYSSWPKLVRVTAYIMRFIARCRRRLTGDSSGEPAGPGVTAGECSGARTRLLKQIQAALLPKELHRLANRLELPSKSSILALRPFLDEEGLLRVGGRISRAPLPWTRRHPILLASHRITKQIVDHAHVRGLHAGVQLTLSIVRRDFWVIRGRGVVREQIHRCVVCARERAAVPSQIMADLPRVRVSAPARCFAHCGVDYAGPVLVRASAGRGIATRKAYIALFICLASRAVHLELVCDYSTRAFLKAFSRFAARRGIPNTVYSDNGTNFVGADRELTVAYRAALRDPNFLSSTALDGVNWRFIPPAAPHFGGLWEAGIKSVKHHVRSVLRSYTLTFEEYATLLCRIEACLNSRPIAPISDSLDDYEPLTPGHLLVGFDLGLPPSPSTLHISENRLTRWQLVRQLTERFWRVWYHDYVNTLQQRGKWRKVQPSIQVGKMVLIRNTTLPPCKWELGRVTQCHPGPDGLTRVVTVRTANSTLQRPIVKICLLPVHCETE
ncbi:uncharacterized protein LOC112589369 [Harpegnathos saltator]|uniref:uncharacterized protein LOC112589369 n=1 Tax=Harpegnathos saltator TaxID=610380 RepID=UPI000DBEEA75|nr:uncharacterized protein LOC112589369 [Harpegnathos saltator]